MRPLSIPVTMYKLWIWNLIIIVFCFSNYEVLLTFEKLIYTSAFDLWSINHFFKGQWNHIFTAPCADSHCISILKICNSLWEPILNQLADVLMVKVSSKDGKYSSFIFSLFSKLIFPCIFQSIVMTLRFANVKRIEFTIVNVV